jgi:cytochrome c oxidase cbb3-type subunit 3
MSTAYQPDQLLDHADEADGIQEYDNRLPTWWLWLFYVTIAAGAWVFVDWHVINPKSQAALYDAEAAIAAEKYVPLVPVDVEFTPERIARGAAHYEQNCVACHAADGTGGIGPDLTNGEWLHGGTAAAINHTVFYGVDGKGMIGWASILGPEGVADVSAYVHQMGGGVDE